MISNQRSMIKGFFSWLPEPWTNIDIDFDVITASLQDVRCIGELRARWKEIKNIQKGYSKESMYSL